MRNQRSGWVLPGRIILAALFLVGLLFSPCEQVNAHDTASTARGDGESLVVSNTTEEINGNITSPAELINDPGLDGISLTEAIIASEATSEYDTITFDPSLSGSVIYIHSGLPSIGHGNLTINGDIDGNGTPDITIDGSSSANDTGFNLYGASNVVIRGFAIRNYSKHGVSINPDASVGRGDVENIVIYQNDITVSSAAVQLMIYAQSHTSISSIEIKSNNLHDSESGISIIAGMGTEATDNQISDVTISANTINNPGYRIAIFISPAAQNGISGNTISNIEIRGNHIYGHTNSSILVDSSNQMNCDNNTVDGLVIADNIIDGVAVTIELVGESGSYSTDNLMTNVTITDNVLTGGGIHISTASGFNASNNEISSIRIERNGITSGTANGIYLVAGSGGAHNNTIEDVTILSNFIKDNGDAGILIHGYDSSSPNNSITNVTILNQTLIENGIGSGWAGGINVNTKDSSNTIDNVTIANSILWGNDGNDAIRGSVEPDTVQYNLLNDIRFTGSDGNFYQDPDFVDSASGDYRLKSTSPCVDAGDPVTDAGDRDFDRNIRVRDGDGDDTAVVDLGAWEYSSIAMQEIDVLGSSISILNGDAVPATWDGTDFGSAAVMGDPVQVTFTIKNTGDAALKLTGVPRVAITGANAADFTVTGQPVSQVNGGQSVTFTVEFAPLGTGYREATVNIVNNDSDENPFSYAILGYGTEMQSVEIRNYLPLLLFSGQ